MKCEHITHQIEQLNLDDINKPLATEISTRIKECDVCMNQYQRHLAYLHKMQAAPTPSLHPSAAAKMLKEASLLGEKKSKKDNGFIKGFIAASVLALSVFGTYTTINQDDALVVKQSQIEFIDKNVTIIIHSKTEIYDAELDLILPQEVAIAGFENIHELTWPVDLKKGANILELPVRVHRNNESQQPLSILATLYHESDERNFEFNIDLTKS